MGQSCEQMAKQWGITRAEQDALAARSHMNAAAAYDKGFMNELLVPFGGLKAGQQPAARHQHRKAGQAPARIRSRPRRHLDGG